MKIKWINSLHRDEDCQYLNQRWTKEVPRDIPFNPAWPAEKIPSCFPLAGNNQILMRQWCLRQLYIYCCPCLLQRKGKNAHVGQSPPSILMYFVGKDMSNNNSFHELSTLYIGYLISKPHSNPSELALLAPFYRWPGEVNCLPNGIGLKRSRDMLQSPVYLTPKPVLFSDNLYCQSPTHVSKKPKAWWLS